MSRDGLLIRGNLNVLSDSELISNSFSRTVEVLHIPSLEPMANDKGNETAKLAFIRIYKALFAVTGGDSRVMRHWLITENKALGMAPLDLILRRDLDKIEDLLTRYLRAHR